MRSWRIVPGRALLFTAIVLLAGDAARAGGAASVDQLESFLGLSAGTLDGIGNGPVVNGSALQTSFTATAGQVLSFQYTFLTDEDPTSGPLNIVNDFAFVTLNSQDPTSIADVVGSAFSSSSTTFAMETATLTFTMTLADAGLYTLGIGVANVTDASFPSGLLVDGLRLDSNLLPNGSFEDGTWTGFTTIGNTALVTAAYGSTPPDGTNQALLSAAVPEPSSVVSLGLGGLLVLVGIRRRAGV